MKTTKLFRKTILSLARKHGATATFETLEDAPVGTKLRLRLGASFDYLDIERHEPNTLTVAHRSQDGRIACDPEITFWTGGKAQGWVAAEIIQVLTGRRTLARYTQAQGITHLAPRAQADATTFANQWARILNMQGWADAAEVVEKVDPNHHPALEGITIPPAVEKRIPVKQITFKWSESYNDALPDFPLSVTTWEESDRVLHQLAENIPEGDTTYYKTGFVVEWADDEIYLGRYDLRRGDLAFYGLLARHMALWLGFSGGVYCPAHMTRHEYGAYLARDGGPSPANLQSLVAREFGDGRAWGGDESAEAAVKTMVTYSVD